MDPHTCLLSGSITCPECCMEFESGSYMATHMAYEHVYISTAVSMQLEPIVAGACGNIGALTV